jgi:hypothetical protein
LVAGNVDGRGNLDSAQTLEERLEIVQERRRNHGKKLFRNDRDPDQIGKAVLCYHSPLPNPLPSNKSQNKFIRATQIRGTGEKSDGELGNGATSKIFYTSAFVPVQRSIGAFT